MTHLLQTVFFDSHGDAHVTCDAAEHAAAAFGPSGISRPLTAIEARILRLDGAASHHAAAAGRVVPGEWDTLADGGGLLAVVNALPGLIQATEIAAEQTGGSYVAGLVRLIRILGIDAAPIVGAIDPESFDEDDVLDPDAD